MPGKEEIDAAQDVYEVLKKTFLLLDDYDRRFFISYGLSPRQFWALQRLDEHSRVFYGRVEPRFAD
jgi:hypothetical protein